MRGKSFVTVEATYLGSAEEAEALLAPLRMIPAMWADTMDTVQLERARRHLRRAEDPMPAMEFSGLLTDFDDGAVDALLRAVGTGLGFAARRRAVASPRRCAGSRDGRRRAGRRDRPSRTSSSHSACRWRPNSCRQSRRRSPEPPTARPVPAAGARSFTFLGSDDDPTRAFSDDGAAAAARDQATGRPERRHPQQPSGACNPARREPARKRPTDRVT